MEKSAVVKEVVMEVACKEVAIIITIKAIIAHFDLWQSVRSMVLTTDRQNSGEC